MSKFVFPKRENKNLSLLAFKIEFNGQSKGGGQGFIFNASLIDEDDKRIQDEENKKNKDKNDKRTSDYIAKKSKEEFGLCLEDEFKKIQMYKSFCFLKAIKIQTVLSENKEEDKYIIMECLPISLKDYASPEEDKPITLSNLQIALIIVSQFYAVQFLHNQRIPTFHHDLKPENVMLFKFTNFYLSILIDFGLIKTGNSSITDSFGTRNYRYPGAYTALHDLYSIGLMILELIYKINFGEFKNDKKYPFRYNYNYDSYTLYFKDDKREELSGFEKIMDAIIGELEKTDSHQKPLINEIMKCLTNRESLEELMTNNSKDLDSKDLDKYFEVLEKVDITMKYKKSFTDIAGKIYNNENYYKSMLFSMFHQKNYLYNRLDFSRYQDSIIDIYDKFSQDKTKLMEEIAQFHIDIDFFHFAPLFKKLYKMATKFKHPINDDEKIFNSKLFQIFTTFNFEGSWALKFFADSITTMIYGVNQQTVENIKEFFGKDSIAKFNYLYVKAQEIYDRDIKEKKKSEVTVINNIKEKKKSEVTVIKNMKQFNAKVYDWVTHLKESGKIDNIFEDFGLKSFIKLDFENRFRDLAFYDFVDYFGDKEESQNVDDYKRLRYYKKEIFDKFLEEFYNKFGDDYIYMAILFYYINYEKKIINVNLNKNGENDEESSSYIDIEDVYTECPHIFDYLIIYKIKNIDDILCEDIKLKCQRILPDCIRRLDEEKFYSLIDLIFIDSEKNIEVDAKSRAEILRKEIEYHNENIGNSPVEALIAIYNCIFKLGLLKYKDDNSQQPKDDEPKYKNASDFWACNFEETENNFVKCVEDKKIYEKNIERDNDNNYKVDQKVYFDFTYEQCSPFSLISNSTIETYRLIAPNSIKLKEYLKEDVSAKDRSLIMIHLAYYYSFLINLPHSVSFQIIIKNDTECEENIFIQKDTKIPKISLGKSNDTSYMNLQKQFSEVLKTIKGDLKNEYLEATILTLSFENIPKYEMLAPSFPEIFYDFFDTSTNYNVFEKNSESKTDFDEFRKEIIKKFRYDLSNPDFRCIANQIFGYDYLFKIDYLFTKIINKGKNTLTKENFVKEVCDFGSEEINTYNILKNKDKEPNRNYYRKIINLIDDNFSSDPYNFKHSLYQMYYQKKDNAEGYPENELIANENSIEIDVEDSEIEYLSQIYHITFKFIAPMKYKVKNTKKIVFEVPSNEYSISNPLFHDKNNIMKFLLSLLSGLAFLLKYNKNSEPPHLFNKEPKIYINDNSEAIFLPYSINEDKAFYIMKTIINEFSNKEISNNNIFKEISNSYLFKEISKIFKNDGNKNVIDIWNDISIRNINEYAPFNYTQYIPFSYDKSLKFIDYFGLDYTKALNGYLYFAIKKNCSFNDIINGKYNANDKRKKCKSLEDTICEMISSDLLDFIRKINCLSPLFIQFLEQNKRNDDNQIKEKVNKYLESYLDIVEYGIDKYNKIIVENKKNIYGINSTIDKYKKSRVVIKTPNKKHISEYKNRYYLSKIKRMFWILKILPKDVSDKFFVHEEGFHGFSIIIDYYKRRDLADNYAPSNKHEPLFQEMKDKINAIIRISLGVAYLHEEGFFHGDLKSSNIFIDKNKDNDEMPYIPKIADLISFRPNNDNETTVYTELYKTSDISDFQADIFALGVVILEVFSHKKADTIILKNNPNDIDKKKGYRNFNIEFEEDGENYKYIKEFLDEEVFNLEKPTTSEIKNFLKVLYRMAIKNDPSFQPYFDHFEVSWSANCIIENSKQDFDNINFEGTFKEIEKHKGDVEGIVEVLLDLSQKLYKRFSSSGLSKDVINDIREKIVDKFDNIIKNYGSNFDHDQMAKIEIQRILLKGFVGLDDDSLISSIKNNLLEKVKKLLEINNEENAREIGSIIDAFEKTGDYLVGTLYYHFIYSGVNSEENEPNYFRKDIKLRMKSILFFYSVYLKLKENRDQYKLDPLNDIVKSFLADVSPDELDREIKNIDFNNKDVQKDDLNALLFCNYYSNLGKFEKHFNLFENIFQEYTSNKNKAIADSNDGSNANSNNENNDGENGDDNNDSNSNIYINKMIEIFNDRIDKGDIRKIFFENMLNLE